MNMHTTRAGVAAVLLAGCGGGSDYSATSSPPPAGESDTHPLAVRFTAPADLATGLTGTQALAVSASDDVGVAGVEFQVDGAPAGGEVTSPPYTASIDTAA